MRTKQMLALVVALAATTGVAQAQVAGDGLIHGCLARSGTLRVIDPLVRSCRTRETPITWTQNGSGPRGEPGPQGERGPEGPAGPPGSGTIVRWANVSKNGAVHASSGVVSTNARSSAGFYLVKFDRDVTPCAWIVSRSISEGTADYDPRVQLTAFGLGLLGFDAATVEVTAVSVTGSFADQAFSLAVFCP